MSDITPDDITLLTFEQTMFELNYLFRKAIVDGWLSQQRIADRIHLDVLNTMPLSTAIFNHEDMIRHRYIKAGWAKVNIGNDSMHKNYIRIELVAK